MKKFIITTFILSTLAIPSILLAQEPDPAKETCSGDGLCLNVPIGGKDTVSGLGEYIQLWYTFVIGAVGIMATIIIMYAGFKWLASRGNAGVIQNSKEKIWSAIIGLFLAFASFMILEIINSDLVNIGLPNLDTGNIEFTNTDNDLDNDRDIVDQALRNIAQYSYDHPNGYEPLYVAIENAVESIIAQNNEEVLAEYLSSHNINVDNTDNILRADPEQIMALTRMGNQFGNINVDRYDPNTGIFYLSDGEDDVVSQLISADNNGFESNTYGEGDFAITRINEVDFDYVASNGQAYHYDLNLTHRNNIGQWEVRFQ